MKKLVVASLVLAGIFSINSCARQGTPSGGPKDVTPPVLIGATPDTLAVNVDPNIKTIELKFDEYIQIKEYNKNVVVSPPFSRNPIVSPLTNADKVVKIKLQEPLQPNTTYSFNFGDAIQDYNENNKLSNFRYVFSTGAYIDSLSVQGKVYSGYDFELPKKVLVGLYEVNDTYNDSVILKSKPYYISRVNEKGEYNLKYLRPGNYRLVAFEDQLENNQYDFGKEKVAYKNEVINLNANQTQDLKLFLPKPAYRLVKSEQKGYGHIVFRTEGASQPLDVKVVQPELKSGIIDVHQKNDSINFWFNPKVEEFKSRNERLKFAVKHGEKTDTVTVLYTAPTNEYEPLYKTVNESKLAPSSNFKIASSAPIKSINKNLINVFKDTVQIPFDVAIDSVDKQIVHFKFEKDLDEKFEINAYPKAFTDIFDQPNDTLVYQIKTGTREDFGNLRLRINNLDDSPIILQLIKKEQKFNVIEERVGVMREFYFPNLLPGDYYIRLLVDKNRNGIWDTGDWLQQIQPEPVYIYPSKITVRAMWDADETWMIGADSDKFVLPDEKKQENTNQSNKR